MKEVSGNIWDYHNKGDWIAITTNGDVKSNGEAVMGKGVALQAKRRFPELPYELGQAIKVYGNRVILLDGMMKVRKIFSFPVKHHWWEKASLELIKESAENLAAILATSSVLYTVRPGCGNGGLDWKDVKPILEEYFDDRFVIVQN